MKIVEDTHTSIEIQIPMDEFKEKLGIPSTLRPFYITQDYNDRMVKISVTGSLPRDLVEPEVDSVPEPATEVSVGKRRRFLWHNS